MSVTDWQPRCNLICFYYVGTYSTYFIQHCINMICIWCVTSVGWEHSSWVATYLIFFNHPV